MLKFGLISTLEARLITLEETLLAKEIIMVDEEFVYNLIDIEDKKVGERNIWTVKDNLKNMMLSRKMNGSKITKIQFKEKKLK